MAPRNSEKTKSGLKATPVEKDITIDTDVAKMSIQKAPKTGAKRYPFLKNFIAPLLD